MDTSPGRLTPQCRERATRDSREPAHRPSRVLAAPAFALTFAAARARALAPALALAPHFVFAASRHLPRAICLASPALLPPLRALHAVPCIISAPPPALCPCRFSARITSIRSLPDAQPREQVNREDEPDQSPDEQEDLSEQHVNLEVGFAYRELPTGQSAESKAKNLQ